MEVKVSIVVPVYNVPVNYLRTCVESLMAQTLREIEIILVDDGSTDDSGKICDEYAGRDERIRVIHKENGGLSAARNTGVRAALGKWVMLVDGDDWIEPETCMEASREGERGNAQIVCWEIIKDFGYKKILLNAEKYLEDGKVYQGEECSYLQELVLCFDSYVTESPAKLFLREYIVENQIYHNDSLRQGMEGIEFCFRLFEKADRVLFLNRYWYHYTFNKDSISTCTTEKNNDYIIRCLEEIKGNIQRSPRKEQLMSWYKNRILYVIVTTAISGYFHPESTRPFKERCAGFCRFLEQPLIKEALHQPEYKNINWQRRLILFLVRHRMFWALQILGKMRQRQKLAKSGKIPFSII